MLKLVMILLCSQNLEIEILGSVTIHLEDLRQTEQMWHLILRMYLISSEGVLINSFIAMADRCG